MGKLVEVTLEIDAELKEQAEKVCMENGLTLEEATVLFFEETVRTALRNRSGLGRVYSADAEILHNTFSNSNDSDTERPKGAENRACVHRFE